MIFRTKDTRRSSAGPWRTGPWRPARRWPDMLGVPAVPIILAAGAVHIVRRNVFDAVLFFSAAALILLDAHRSRPAGLVMDPPHPRWAEPVTLTVAAVGFGAVFGPLDRGGAPVRVALAVVGVIAVAAVVAAGGPETRTTARPARRGWVPWAGLAVAACLWELTQFLQQPDPQTGSHDHPTLSVILDPLLNDQLTRCVVLALWLAAGWWLVRAVLMTRPPRTGGIAGSRAGDQPTEAQPTGGQVAGDRRPPTTPGTVDDQP